MEVTGYADTTGSAAFNQQLSDRRSQAVIQYLEEQGDIPVHRILPATGLGTTHEAAANNTSSGRKLNRRVEVKVLVNQGLVSQNNTNEGGQNGNTGAVQNTPNTPNAAGTPASSQPNTTPTTPTTPQQ